MSDTIILGSGIVGLSTAYYLSQSGDTQPESIHLVDPIAELFHCASGFAGGFLAEDCEFTMSNPASESNIDVRRVRTFRRLPRRIIFQTS